ncbi:CxxH/CxxC protein [Salipaludibacillus daqingensis]|uniref:CxxH/CxxC protein n=1 Tax=Salipaludibacillus daqingensis TaxID=3041001 RepID=UPI002476CC2D|nr:CxxH/CxxC protein [Salipaludibacillus daqingensis]
MIYSCPEHSEEAIEEAIEDGGLPPIFEKIQTELHPSKKCFICNEKAVYQVTQAES